MRPGELRADVSNHTAREDATVFPAWKEVVSARQLQEMGEKFEDIERQ